jgi:hypothetical protein
MNSPIIDKLFASRWNYAWNEIDRHIIALFYKKGGFAGLYEFIAVEKQRLNDRQLGMQFESYYSADLLDTLQQAKEELKDSDFRAYIFGNHNIDFNRNDFKKLEKHGLLNHFYEFGGNFRGDIVNCSEIGTYGVIETFSKKDGRRFCSYSDLTSSFDTMEQALIFQIFKGQHFPTLKVLLDNVNQSK